VLRRSSFFKGRPLRGSQVSDVIWLRHDGAAMSDEDWANSETRSLGVFYSGEGLDDVDAEGAPVRDDDMLLLFNSHSEPIEFALPFPDDKRAWVLLVDTAGDAVQESKPGGASTTLLGPQLKLFMRARR
jgi:glycogen operon protein